MLHCLQSDSEGSEGNEDDEENNYCGQESSQTEAPAYRNLIAIHAGKPKGGLKDALKVEPNKVRRLSLSEQSLEKATASHGTDVVRYLT